MNVLVKNKMIATIKQNDANQLLIDEVHGPNKWDGTVTDFIRTKGGRVWNVKRLSLIELKVKIESINRPVRVSSQIMVMV